MERSGCCFISHKMRSKKLNPLNVCFYSSPGKKVLVFNVIQPCCCCIVDEQLLCCFQLFSEAGLPPSHTAVGIQWELLPPDGHTWQLQQYGWEFKVGVMNETIRRTQVLSIYKETKAKTIQDQKFMASQLMVCMSTREPNPLGLCFQRGWMRTSGFPLSFSLDDATNHSQYETCEEAGSKTLAASVLCLHRMWDWNKRITKQWKITMFNAIAMTLEHSNVIMPLFWLHINQFYCQIKSLLWVIGLNLCVQASPGLSARAAAVLM